MAIQRKSVAARQSASPNNNALPLSGTPRASNTNNANSNNSSSSSNSNAFNPKLISSQIFAMQTLHYLFLSLLVQVNHVFFHKSITLDRIFTAQYLNVWSREGWIDNGAILLSSLFGSILLAIIVEKSKKCLDFSVTLFTLHLLLCSLYDGFPTSWDWWILNIMGLIVMVLLGEFLCSRVELREIPLL